MLAAPQRPFVFSYSFFNAYENCPYKAYRTYLAPPPLKVPYREGEPQRWGNHVHKSFQKRLASGEPLPDDLTQYEWMAAGVLPYRPRIELKLGMDASGNTCGYYDDKCIVRGVLDVASVRDEYAIIVDWKTGNKRDHEKDELAIHGMLLKAAHPELLQIIAHYAWLKTNEIGKAHNVSLTDLTRARVFSKIAHVQHALKLNHFPKNQNPLCAWCDVYDCNFNSNPKRLEK